MNKKLIVILTNGTLPELGYINGPCINPFLMDIDKIETLLRYSRNVQECNPTEPTDRIKLNMSNLRTKNFSCSKKDLLNITRVENSDSYNFYLNNDSSSKNVEDIGKKAVVEADRKAKEEADKKAKEDADMKAAEEAERKAKEDADMKAVEEAEKKVREEANKYNDNNKNNK